MQLATYADARQADAAAADLHGTVNVEHVLDPANHYLRLRRSARYGTYTEAKNLKARFAATYTAAIILP